MGGGGDIETDRIGKDRGTLRLIELGRTMGWGLRLIGLGRTMGGGGGIDTDRIGKDNGGGDIETDRIGKDNGGGGGIDTDRIGKDNGGGGGTLRLIGVGRTGRH